jgi:hypothetical protein
VSLVNGDQVIAQAKAGADLRTTVSRGQSEGGTAYMLGSGTFLGSGSLGD